MSEFREGHVVRPVAQEAAMSPELRHDLDLLMGELDSLFSEHGPLHVRVTPQGNQAVRAEIGNNMFRQSTTEAARVGIVRLAKDFVYVELVVNVPGQDYELGQGIDDRSGQLNIVTAVNFTTGVVERGTYDEDWKQISNFAHPQPVVDLREEVQRLLLPDTGFTVEDMGAKNARDIFIHEDLH